ncbi:hypothetical protein J6590_058965 [Homalodisca vitripennis]|nr:hypothetical protein J6590_058965 [Homalodisca vitripennis]
MGRIYSYSTVSYVYNETVLSVYPDVGRNLRLKGISFPRHNQIYQHQEIREIHQSINEREEKYHIKNDTSTMERL